MAVRRIDGAWYVDVRWRGQRYRKRSPDDSRAGAHAYELRLRQELQERGFLPDRTATLETRQPRTGTLATFAQEWFSMHIRTHLRPSSRRSYEVALRCHLLPVLGHLPLAGIKTRELEAFKAAKHAAGLHPKTINGFLSVLRSCLTFAVECGRLDELPRFRWLKVPPPRFDYLNPAESRRLIAGFTEQPYRLMIHVALRTGMRVGELLALRWECIDFDRELILVRTTQTRGEAKGYEEHAPKNNRARYIPIAADLLDELSARRREQGYVFSDLLGRPLSYDGVAKALRRASRTAGLRAIGWHTLRHSFATQLTSEGAPLHGVQAFLGHSTMQMTLRYSHFAPTAFRKTVNLLAAAEDREATILGSEMGSGAITDTRRLESRTRYER